MTAPLTCGCLLCLVLAPLNAWTEEKPQADSYEHLLSPAVALSLDQPKPFLAWDLIAEMDAAGIRRAVVLSLAYRCGKWEWLTWLERLLRRRPRVRVPSLPPESPRSPFRARWWLGW